MTTNRIDELAEEQSQSDRRYFDRNPTRSHRIRLAHPAEIAQGENTFAQAAQSLPEGHTWYTAVRCVSQGMRLRLFFSGPHEFAAGILSESQAAEIYETVANLFGPQTHAVEAGMREAAQ